MRRVVGLALIGWPLMTLIVLLAAQDISVALLFLAALAGLGVVAFSFILGMSMLRRDESS